MFKKLSVFDLIFSQSVSQSVSQSFKAGFGFSYPSLIPKLKFIFQQIPEKQKTDIENKRSDALCTADVCCAKACNAKPAWYKKSLKLSF